MLAPKKYSRQKLIIIISSLGLVWLVIFILVYFNFWHDSSGSNNQAVDWPAKRPSVISGQLKLGDEVLEDDRFINLKIFGSLPLQTSQVGRADPFSIPTNNQPKTIRRP
ncbi:MAG: hypothetical protein ACOZAJ_02245 [Patescibacteria group bacterium]